MRCLSQLQAILSRHRQTDSIILLGAFKADGDTVRDYQTERDEITRGLVRDVKHYVTQYEEVDKAIRDFLPRFECTLMDYSQ